MKSLTPVAILDNATSKRFLNDEEIRASLPPEGEKVVWHLSGVGIGDGAIIEGWWSDVDDKYGITDQFDGERYSLSEFSHWYREEDLNAEMLAFIIEVNAAYKIEWINKKAGELIRRAEPLTASEMDLITQQDLS